MIGSYTKKHFKMKKNCATKQAHLEAVAGPASSRELREENMSNKIDRKALSQMVQVVVRTKGTQEVSYLGGGRIRINPLEGTPIEAITIAMPGYHDKTTRVDLLIEKRNESEVSRERAVIR